MGDGPRGKGTVEPLHFLTDQPRPLRKCLCPPPSCREERGSQGGAVRLSLTGEPRESEASKAPHAKGRMVSAPVDPDSNIFQAADLT